MNTRTLSPGGDAVRPASSMGASLVLAMRCGRPTAGSSRFSLADIDEVVVGRGAECRATRTTIDERVRLRIDVDDVWMSTDHFRLTRSGSGLWVLTDAGSKNGTNVDGMRRPGAELADGTVIDGGRSVFVFRDGGETAADLLDVRPPVDGRPDLQTLAPAWQRELDTLARVARSGVSVITYGESGTGKEVVARAIHAMSGRRGPFVAVNCGALPPTLIQAELFGAEKGAFSGADSRREGLVRAASGGTLFLDEIAELQEQSQATLLRVLQEGEVLPLGATQPVPVDLRVVAATHQDLKQRVASGAFRHDLYARLRGFELELPPLRERREDLGLLVGGLLRRIAGARADALELQIDAARAVFLYAWPYNVRELAQAFEAAVAIAEAGTIDLAHLPRELRQPPDPRPAASAAPRDERAVFEATLRAHGGNVSAVARALNTSRSQVRRLAARFGIDLSTLRD